MNPYSISEVLIFLIDAYKAYQKIDGIESKFYTLKESEFIANNKWRLISLILFASILRYLGSKSSTPNHLPTEAIVSHTNSFLTDNPKLARSSDPREYASQFTERSQDYILNNLEGKYNQQIKLIAVECGSSAIGAPSLYDVLLAGQELFNKNSATMAAWGSGMYTTRVLTKKVDFYLGDLYSDLLAQAKINEGKISALQLYSSDYFVSLASKITRVGLIRQPRFDEELPEFHPKRSRLIPFLLQPRVASTTLLIRLPRKTTPIGKSLPKPGSLAEQLALGFSEVIKVIGGKR